jgi:hypothetical protein
MSEYHFERDESDEDFLKLTHKQGEIFVTLDFDDEDIGLQLLLPDLEKLLAVCKELFAGERSSGGLSKDERYLFYERSCSNHQSIFIDAGYNGKWGKRGYTHIHNPRQFIFVLQHLIDIISRGEK